MLNQEHARSHVQHISHDHRTGQRDAYFAFRRSTRGGSIVVIYYSACVYIFWSARCASSCCAPDACDAWLAAHSSLRRRLVMSASITHQTEREDLSDDLLRCEISSHTNRLGPRLQVASAKRDQRRVKRLLSSGACTAFARASLHSSGARGPRGGEQRWRREGHRVPLGQLATAVGARECRLAVGEPIARCRLPAVQVIDMAACSDGRLLRLRALLYSRGAAHGTPLNVSLERKVMYGNGRL